MDKKAFLSKLQKLSEGNAEYASFNKRIVNTKKDVIGVRLPDIRRLAKEISKGMDYAAVFSFIKSIDINSYEQTLTSGLVIDYAEISDAEKIELTREYLKYVDSWAHIDSFVSPQKKPDDGLLWDFAIECLDKEEEFTVRYGVICLMKSFLTKDNIPNVFRILRGVRNEAYYVKMGMAWLYAEASLQDFEMTIKEMGNLEIDVWTRRKGLQKMLESNRLTAEQKSCIRVKRDQVNQKK
jgi:3-methyladenine DNA glycosylase AlkD